MRIRRLGWAGLELEAGGQSAVVDLFEDVGRMEPFVGRPHEPLPAPSARGEVALAMVTHLHEDHADPAALRRALRPGATVLRPARAEGEGLETIATAGAEEGFVEHGLSARVVEPWQTVAIGPFRVTAVPAADGFGDPQVSWIVAAGGRRIVHCGDTLFHGWWWLARMRHGPFDAAFLPVNGPIVDLPHRQPPSDLAAAMTPEQAAEAAALLEAPLAVPIHYDALNNPPIYSQVDRPADRFVDAAGRRGVRGRALRPSEELDWADAAPDPGAAVRLGEGR